MKVTQLFDTSHRTRARVVMGLLSAVLLTGNGCMITSSLTESASRQAITYDKFGHVEKAYKSPKDSLLVCTTGTLAGASEASKFTVATPLGDSTLRPYGPYHLNSDAVTFKGSAQIPRTGIRKGWPTDDEIARQQLVSVPVASTPWPAPQGQLSAAAADVKALEVAEEGVVNVPWRAPFRFAYVKRPSPDAPLQCTTFSLEAETKTSGEWKMVFLPVTIAADAVTLPIQFFGALIVLGSLGGMGCH